MTRDEMMAFKINTINNWIRRRLVKGIRPTADEIWLHIHQNWPKLSAEEMETIFQSTK